MKALRDLFTAREGQALIAVAVLISAVLLSVTDKYLLLVLTQVLIWALLGLAWNLIGGYAGQMSFGHAAFFGVGAYCVAAGYAYANISPWIGLVVAALMGGLAALVIGAITLRLRGHYFALAMLAYPMALLYVFEWAGLQEVTMPMRDSQGWTVLQFSDPRWFGMLALAAVLVVSSLTFWIERSRHGLCLAAVREDEAAAQASGVNVFAVKLRAMVLSGAIAAVAGGLYAAMMLIVTPRAVFGMFVSAQAIIVCLFGGVATFWGPLIGASVLVPMSEWLTANFGSSLPGIQGVMYGAAIIAVVLFAKEGLYWRISDALARRWGVGSKRKNVGESPECSTRGEDEPVSRSEAEAPPGNDDRVILDVKGLGRAFGGVVAVADFNITVRKGAIHGLIGPNGAGKTTAFNLINGFVRPDKGSVILDGIDATGNAPEVLCARGVGRTFQTPRAFRRLSVRDNVRVGALTQTRSDDDARDLTEHALGLAGLSEAEADQLASSASVLQLRLMEIARALAGRPSLLMLDETLAGLGREDLPRVVAAIKGIAASGVTILIIEHTMHVVASIVDELTVLDHGRVIANGQPDLVLQMPEVIESYLGKKWMLHAA